MKRFLIKIAAFILVLAVIFLPITIAVDPYNVFHYANPRSNGVEPNKNFIKTKYILNNQDKFDSLVFGSSRAGFFHVDMLPDGTYYDMASSEALPAEHVRTLKILIKNGFTPKNVIVMVDDISCFVDPATHENVLYRVPYPEDDLFSQISFYLRYCDLLTTFESMDVILNHQNTDLDYTERFRTTGTENLNIAPEFDGTMDGAPAVGYWADYYSLRTEEAIADMQELINLCKENNINLKIVTNPLYYLTYEKAVENGYLDFLEELSKITDFYNFSSISSVTTTNGCYYETSHFTPQVGIWMIGAIYEDNIDKPVKDQGFGVHVTEENREEFIQFLHDQAIENDIIPYQEEESE